MKVILAVLSVIFATGCVGPYAHELRLRAAAHQSIEVYIIPLMPGGDIKCYRLIDDTLVMTERYRLIRLSPEVAAAAWQAIRRLGVLEWQEHYPSAAVDGQAWSVRLKIGAQEREVRGENAYPATAPPYSSTPVSNANAFEALIAVLDQLEKEPNKAPEPTTTAVTIRAPSSTARASRGRGSS